MSWYTSCAGSASGGDLNVEAAIGANSVDACPELVLGDLELLTQDGFPQDGAVGLLVERT